MKTIARARARMTRSVSVVCIESRFVNVVRLCLIFCIERRNGTDRAHWQKQNARKMQNKEGNSTRMWPFTGYACVYIPARRHPTARQPDRQKTNTQIVWLHLRATILIRKQDGIGCTFATMLWCCGCCDTNSLVGQVLVDHHRHRGDKHENMHIR